MATSERMGDGGDVAGERVAKERPILFSAPMVRAILAGTKTQTRRVCKGQRALSSILDFRLDGCPYGKPGDRLWVKETWRPRLLNNGYPGAPDLSDVSVEYAADGELRVYADEEIDQANPDWSMPKAAERGNVSPLFMPRWATRILLEITDVRVQRLQDISAADALAEGIDTEGDWYAEGENLQSAGSPCSPERYAFASLWRSINGDESWEANPWVWAVSFRRIAA